MAGSDRDWVYHGVILSYLWITLYHRVILPYMERITLWGQLTYLAETQVIKPTLDGLEDKVISMLF